MPIALLLRTSGAVQARLDVDVLPDVLEHGGRRWVRSHTTVSGAAYEVERVARRSSGGSRADERRQVAGTREAWRAGLRGGTS